MYHSPRHCNEYMALADVTGTLDNVILHWDCKPCGMTAQETVAQAITRSQEERKYLKGFMRETKGGLHNG